MGLKPLSPSRGDAIKTSKNEFEMYDIIWFYIAISDQWFLDLRLANIQLSSNTSVQMIWRRLTQIKITYHWTVNEIAPTSGLERIFRNYDIVFNIYLFGIDIFYDGMILIVTNWLLWPKNVLECVLYT